jgi:DNA-binding response OmpR family regulator
MVYGIVKQHNGFINCCSEPGQGTVFRIYLPLIDGAADPASEPEHRELPRGNETVLLVEDDHVLREMVAELLRDFGYQVVTAVDGEDAVRRFRELRQGVQLVILDVIMPKLNGRDAYDAMCALAPGVKGLFMSGYTADISCCNPVPSASCAFVSKPIDVRELLTEVRRLLDAAPP